jgi:hypothetical protein
MRNPSKVCRINARSAQSIWGQLPPTTLESLKLLTNRLALSVVAGDLQLLENRWYVTHSGLLRIAQRRRCSGIKTIIETAFRTLLQTVGCSRPQSTRAPLRRGLSVTVTQIPPTFPRSCMEPKCALPKREPSTAPCARHTGSASVR